VEEQTVLNEYFRQLLLDSRPILLVFAATTTVEDRLQMVMHLDTMYKALGGGELRIDTVSNNELCVLLRPHDDAERNLVY